MENKELKKLFRITFGTEAGQEVLSFLRSVYVKRPTCLAQTPELTYYNLGQKELVEYIIEIMEEDEELEQKIVTGDHNND